MKRGGPLQRRTRLRPVSEKRAAQRQEDTERVLAEGEEFHAAIRGARCVVCGRTDREARRESGFGIQAHHGVSQARLRSIGRRDLLWWPGNAIPACEEPCHRQHTTAVKRIPWEALPESVVEFAEALGLLEELGREYPRSGGDSGLRGAV